MILDLLFSGFLWAATDCPQRRLVQKFCYVQSGEIKVTARNDNITLTTGLGKFVEKIKIAGPKVQWQKVFIYKLGKRTFLDLRVWDLPVGDLQIQSLNWLFFEVHPQGLKLVAEEVAGRRRFGDKVLIDPVTAIQVQAEGNKVKWKLGLKEGEI